MKTLMCTAMLALLPGLAVAACSEERTLLISMFERNGWEIAAQGSSGEIAGNCRLRGLQLVEDAVRLDVAMLEWDLDGLERLQSGKGEVSLTAKLDNLRITPEVEDPWIAYMMTEQNRRSLIDAELEVTWALDDGRVELKSLEVDLPGENSFSLEARVNGLTPAAIAGQIGDLGRIEISSVSATLENNGFADGLILGMIIGQMSGVPGSPQTVMDGTKAEALSAVADLPDDIFSDGSKDALAALIADAPVPWGVLQLSLTGERPLPLSRFLALGLSPTSPDALSRAFDGAKIAVTYVPAPAGE